jgi:hypothetical protein
MDIRGMKNQIAALFWFTAYIVLCAIVLLGLAALYVDYGMLIFWIGVVIVSGIGLLSLRRPRPIYIIEPPHRDGRRYADTDPVVSDQQRNDSRHLPDGRR